MANEMRDKLFELLTDCEIEYAQYLSEECDKAIKGDVTKQLFKRLEFYADRLIENGVIVPLFKNKSGFVKIPCKCKECEHFNNDNPDSTYCEEHSDGWGDNRVYVDEDDYCSFGIKKKGGANNG